MIEFFEKNLGFFIVVTIAASFVIWSIRKEKKEEERKFKEKEDLKNAKQKTSLTEKEDKANGRTSV